MRGKYVRDLHYQTLDTPVFDAERNFIGIACSVRGKRESAD